VSPSSTVTSTTLLVARTPSSISPAGMTRPVDTTVCVMGPLITVDSSTIGPRIVESATATPVPTTSSATKLQTSRFFEPRLPDTARAIAAD
jgi:hypothetical protein